MFFNPYNLHFSTGADTSTVDATVRFMDEFSDLVEMITLIGDTIGDDACAAGWSVDDIEADFRQSKVIPKFMGGDGPSFEADDKVTPEQVIIKTRNYHVIGMYFSIKYCIRVP